MAAALLHLLTTAALPVSGDVGTGDNDERIRFSIENKRLPEALKLFAEQANLDVMFQSAGMDESKRYSLKGMYTPLEALSELLRGTGFEYIHDGHHNVAVRPTSDRNRDTAEDSSFARTASEQRSAGSGQSRNPTERETRQNGSTKSTAGGSQGASIEEVLVTAQKRAENIQDVAVSISAFTGDKINELGFDSTFELATMIPNVSYTGEGSIDQFNIRGVQLSDFSDGNEPPVGIYVDEVYYGTLANHQSQLFDVERVEVLRGPQGTLFGRNTVGGLVHTITRGPTPEFEAYGSVQIGSYEQWIVEGAVSGPLSERVRARIGFRHNEDDGWQDNKVDSGRNKTAETNYTGGRLGLEFDVTDDLALALNVHGVDQNSTPQMHGVFGLFEPGSAAAGNPIFCDVGSVDAGECQSVSVFGPFAGTFIPGNPDPEQSFTDLPSPQFDINSHGAWVKFAWALGAMEIVSITAFESVDKRYDNDPDGPPFEIQGDFRVKADQWSQELRLSGEYDRLKWVGGLFYYQDTKFDWSFSVPPLIQIFGGFTFGLQNEMDLDTESYAVFAQADYSFTDTFKITGGLRWTHETKDLFITDSRTAPNYQATENIDTEKVTWRVGADWQFRDAGLLYASIATGFKSGAFNTSLVGPGDSAPSGEEEIITYEIGAKTDWLDNRLRVNASAFYNDYTDVQAVITTNVNNVPVIRIFNVGALDIKGVELELGALPMDNMELGFTAGWVDGEYEADDPTLVLGDRGIPLDGAGAPHTPEFNLSVLARYRLNLDENGNVVFQISGFWEDDVFLNVANDPFLTQEAHSIWNARVTWISPGERYQVEGFVDNFTDAEAFKGGFMQGGIGLMSREWKPPLMGGVKLTVNF
jgi:iron complex outermembrane receptor protein